MDSFMAEIVQYLCFLSIYHPPPGAPAAQWPRSEGGTRGRAQFKKNTIHILLRLLRRVRNGPGRPGAVCIVRRKVLLSKGA